VALGAELDLHCHISTTMVAAADVLVLYKEYPHTDIMKRAEELIDLLMRTARGDIRPVMTLADTGTLQMIHTTREPARGIVDRISSMEGRDGVLSVSLGHGFPWGDAPDVATRVLVVTDGRPDKGREIALGLAHEVASLRGKLDAGFMGVDEAYDRALACSRGPVVLADKSDNAGGGAPGDATWMIARALERGIDGIACSPLRDPIAVRTCFDAGLGATLPLRFGGKMCPLSGQPIDLEVTLTGLARDAQQPFGKALSGLGDCAAIRGSGIEVVLCATRTQAFDPALFRNVGIEPAERKMVVVKSTQHFHAGFAPLAAEILHVGAPGVVAPDFEALPFAKLSRPRWPFDQAEPEVRLIVG